jgi:hypothetical protein
MKYIIACDTSIQELEKQVNDFITKGYEPLGGISVVKGEHYTHNFFQAMVDGPLWVIDTRTER